MTSEPVQIRPLRADERAAAAAVLARAFACDPLFASLVRDDAARALWLRGLMSAAVSAGFGLGHIYTLGYEPAGVIGLAPPGRFMAPGGVLPAAVQLLGGCLRAGLRNIALRDAFSIAHCVGRAHLDQPHWYVSVLGVDPEFRGRGWGGRMLGKAIAYAEADDLPLYLETGNPDNLGFYGRYGFVVRDEFRIGRAEPVWTLIRWPPS